METATRKKIRVDGAHSLTDVARKVCGDARLCALLHDLNPSLPVTGALPAGTVVVCPSKDEARGFASRMGFTLGFNEKGANGTDARRRWARHQGPPSSEPKVDAVALARSLLERGVTAAEAGRRLAKQCGEADLAALLASTDGAVKQVGGYAEHHALYPRAASRVAAVRSVVDATLRPAGLRTLLEALVKDQTAGAGVLRACAVAPALVQALVDEAPRVVALVARAREIAAHERGARDQTLAKDDEGGSLRPIVDALVDGVEPLAAERPAAAGIEAEADALVKHLEMLKGALKQAEDGLARASSDVVKTLARGLDGARLGRPWPLLAAVCKDLGAAIDDAPATARDLGLGGIVKRRLGSQEGAPAAARGGARTVTVHELHARAATCARAADEGDAFVEKLAPVVIELFGLMRPPPAVDGGTAHAKKARRRMAFEHAMAAGKGGIQADGVAAIAADVIERAKLGGNHAAQRLGRTQLDAIDEAARAITVPLTIHRQPMSELGRALVVAAMALDREVGQGLARPTGREAFVAAAVKHAGRVLSAASCSIAC